MDSGPAAEGALSGMGTAILAYIDDRECGTSDRWCGRILTTIARAATAQDATRTGGLAEMGEAQPGSMPATSHGGAWPA